MDERRLTPGSAGIVLARAIPRQAGTMPALPATPSPAPVALSRNDDQDATPTYRRHRNLVRREDGTLVNVARPRGQLFVCSAGCCCGRVEDGFPAVPSDLYHREWERRRLRNIVHLTIGGCLGPCALANVALLLFDGQALWFHSLNSASLVLALFDYVEHLLDADEYAPPPAPLAAHQFTASAWQPRSDGQPVEDRRVRRPALGGDGSHVCAAEPPDRTDDATEADRRIADMMGPAAAPRKNGELVFEAPWQGRAFGLAVALAEEETYPWDDFRNQLIAQIAGAEQRGDPSGYYERWVAAFERLLVEKGLLHAEEIEERTYEFEFGERDDVF
jgi:nitrile hydratase accessory protein